MREKGLRRVADLPDLGTDCFFRYTERVGLVC